MVEKQKKSNFSISSLSENDLKMLKAGVSQVIDSMTRIDAERENIKRECEALVSTLNVSGAVLKRLAKAIHKASFDKEVEQFELYEEMYKKVK